MILQVKRYNTEIATPKYEQAKKRGNFCRSMFFFTLTDKNGYALSDRKYGYIAFNKTKAVFAMTPEKAKARLQEG